MGVQYIRNKRAHFAKPTSIYELAGSRPDSDHVFPSSTQFGSNGLCNEAWDHKPTIQSPPENANCHLNMSLTGCEAVSGTSVLRRHLIVSSGLSTGVW
ncbi:hypothetical protein GJ744_009842 [Endocarpon pusillum]|uniref:Uncharacterized protein n=1 Tax=Endocarpon pusillum TaxID=364733 RepID=A0A8H7AUI3_9EURO|nr:hypothetical protein GJ744_009842 [Endocarpon pusillum]